MSNSNGRPERRRSAPARSSRTQSRPAGASEWQRTHVQYLERARSASDSGDRIAAENFYQHADHYFRMMQGTAP